MTLQNSYHYTFIHNVFGNFVRETMNYYADYLYPRFSWKVISTYDKAVAYISDQSQYGRETDMPMRPGLILNPSGEMDIESPYGKMAARFPNTAPLYTKYTFDPVYQDENVIVTVGFTRLKGNFEFLALLPSFYEYFDFKILLLQMFRGIGRYNYPIWVNSFIIIPEELYNYEYDNPVTGVHYKLDWDKYGVYDKLIETTNKHEKVLPCRTLPYYKLESISDGSTKLGGAPDLPDWKINFTLEYEVEIPSFLVLETDYLMKKLTMDLTRVGSVYTVNNDIVPDLRTVEELEFVHVFGDDSTAHTEVKVVGYEKLEFRTRYYHIFSKLEVETTIDINIPMPEVVTDMKLLIVNSRFGEVYQGDWTVNTLGTIMTLAKDFCNKFEENDVLEIYVYQEEQMNP